MIELLIALVVVGVLSAVAIVGIGSVVDSGKTAACKSSVSSAQAAAAAYYANNNGVFPATLASIAGVELQLSTGVTVTGNIMNNTTAWSVTYAPATNTFTKTGGGAACS